MAIHWPSGDCETIAERRRITALLRDAGWAVNAKRVERIWRREGLPIPARQPKRRRLWLNDGSCVRLRAERPNHVWSYDFVHDRPRDGRVYRMLNSEPLRRHWFEPNGERTRSPGRR